MKYILSTLHLLSLASLYAEPMDELAFVMKNEGSLSSLLGVREELSEMIDQKFNSQNTTLVNILNGQNERFSQELSHMFSPLADHLNVLKGDISSVSSQLKSFGNHVEILAAKAKSVSPAKSQSPQKTSTYTAPESGSSDDILNYYNPTTFTGFDFSIEWLYWTVQQKSSTFVLTPNGIHQPYPPSAYADSIGKYHSASFDWNSGVRVGLGYTLKRDAWNLEGQYTYYSTHGSDRVNRPSELTLYLGTTNREVNLSDYGVNSMKSHTRFRYEVADLLLARRFLPSSQIILNFFTGATAAWIHENWKVTGTDVVSVSPQVTTITKSNWMFNGGGIRTGLDADWHVGQGISFFNKFSFAALIGHYENMRKTTLVYVPPTVTSNLTPNIRHTNEEETWVVPTTQLEFGINWNYRFPCWSLNLQAGFEINTWYDLHQLHQDNEFLTLPNNDKMDYRNASPVSLWGIGLKAGFTY